MTTTNRCIEAWITFLNSQDASNVSAFLHPDVTILAYQEGPEGPVTSIEGRDAVIAWVQYPPKGRFAFELTNLESSKDSSTEGITLSAAYQVSHTESDFTNRGQWTFTLVGGFIRTLRHVPNAL